MINNNITTEQIEYLLAAGFSMTEIGNKLLFVRGDHRITIEDNELKLWIFYDEEEAQQKEKWCSMFSFTGLDQLNIVRFGLLLEAMNVCQMEIVVTTLFMKMLDNHSHLVKPAILS